MSVPTRVVRVKHRKPKGKQVKEKTATATTKEIAIHPTAMLFPTLAAKEMKELHDDIAANGIRVPLLFNKAETMLIDGRNRWYIAQDLKIARKDLPIEHYKGKDEEIPSVIISRNLFRRHLNDKQRATLVVKLMAPALEKDAKARQSGSFKKDGKADNGDKGRTAEKIAKTAKVSRHVVEQAMKVRKTGGDQALDDIIAGKADLAQKAKAAPRKPRKPAKDKKELTFADKAWRRWSTFLNHWSPTERRQVKELILGWLTLKEGDVPF